MPRPKKDGAGPPKTRSRFGCWPCKARKIKCGEEKPTCKNCQRQGDTCDYSIRLNWAGRSRTKSDEAVTQSTKSLPTSPSTIVFPSPEIFSGTSTPKVTTPLFGPPSKQSAKGHARSRSNVTTPSWGVDPILFAHDAKNPSPGLLAPPDSAHAAAAAAVQDRRIDSTAPSGIPGAHYLRAAWDFPATSMASGSNASPGLVVPMNDANSPLFTTTPTSMDHTSLTATAQPGNDGYFLSADRTKRIRLNADEGPPSAVTLVPYESPQQDGQIVPSPPLMTKSPNSRFLAANPFPGTPQTMASSTSEDQRIFWRSGGQVISPDDGRRASVPVSSLLIDSPPEQQEGVEKRRIQVKESISTFFGYDKGDPDLDIGANDDNNAIVGSPSMTTMATVDGHHIGQTVAMAFEPGGYYARPVPIKIPQLLLPLPAQLANNQINLLYFHHFLNHTARILAPHDCPINPYRTVLPQMAVHDEDLLNLLLAYSACHRARLLKHPEPETRIARWVEDVFPRLRSSLGNPDLISINNVATSIMLASLEIISPGAFGVDIRWYTHLAMAREMFISLANNGQTRPTFSEEQFFLARWFGYLDILGSLSGHVHTAPLSFDIYWVDDLTEPDGTIDCFFGCTRYCMRLLAQVAQLVKEVEPSRLDNNKQVRGHWSAPYETESRANQLLLALNESMTRRFSFCPHGDPNITPIEDATVDLQEIRSTNALYHWAGIIHLLRRVLAYPQDSVEVKNAVQRMLENLEVIRDGSPAEACLLWPIFTAACEANDLEQRQRFAFRLSDVEEFGLKQVIKAKELMERTWEANQPWESLVHEEFVG